MKQVPGPKRKIRAKTPTTSDVFVLWRSLKLGIANSSLFRCVVDRSPAQLFFLLAIVPWIFIRTPPRWLCFSSLKHNVIQLRQVLLELHNSFTTYYTYWKVKLRNYPEVYITVQKKRQRLYGIKIALLVDRLQMPSVQCLMKSLLFQFRSRWRGTRSLAS